MTLAVEIEKRADGVIIVTPTGRLDTNTYRGMEAQVKELLGPPCLQMIFDMAAVKYISSAGVKLILNTRHTLETGGGKLLLAGLQKQVRQVLELIDALPHLTVCDDREAAEAQLTSPTG